MNRFQMSFLGSLRNNEFPMFYDQLCSILEVDDIVDVNLKECLQDLKGHEEEMKYVRRLQGPHRLTSVLRKQSIARKEYLVSLRGKVKAGLNSPIPSEREAAVMLKIWLDKPRVSFHVPSINPQTRLVEDLMHERAIKVEIQEAITEMELESIIDPIVALTEDINDNFMIRAHEQAENVRKVRAIRRAAYADLKRFFKAFDVALSLEKPDESFYSDISKVIDNLLDNYRVKLYARRTRSKNAELYGNDRTPMVARAASTATAERGAFEDEMVKLFAADVQSENGDSENGDVPEEQQPEAIATEHSGAQNGSDQESEHEV